MLIISHFYTSLIVSKLELKIPSFAKINWFLNILGKRSDGFHEICTVFQTVSLFDNLTFSENDELVLTCDDQRIPTDESNLIIKAGELLRERFSVKKGAQIHLEKNIPSPGGLAGGSSNAAVALIGLSAIWDLDIKFSELEKIAAEIGSDVPFFLRGGTALGSGRGTEIESLPDLGEKFLLIVTPDVSVSTVEAYKKLNASDLTRNDDVSILQVCRRKAAEIDLRRTILTNDFENVIFSAEPEIEKVKNELLKNGAIQVLMSGSGASVFGIFDKEQTRQNAVEKLAEYKNWRMFAVATVSSDEYRRAFPKECRRLFPG